METATFKKFANLIYEQSGINLSESKTSLLESRLGKRMRALSIDSHRDYYSYLTQENDANEMVLFLDVITTNLTSFYRESQHFPFLDQVLREWHHQGQRRFRIWCAAASTGEEPYTLAITAREALGMDRVDLRILATDICTDVLHRSMEGRYDAKRVEGIPPNLLAKYFERSKEGNEIWHTAGPALTSCLSFNRLNLSTTPFPMKGPMDVVFCRNVMIYFDDTIRTRLVNDIHRLLKPGGYLMTGHSESLNGLDTPFRMIQPSVYQRVS
jgi:chemotaxis protein methyltransferase CheR